MKRVKKGGIEAACQAALGALVLAALGSLGYPVAWAAAPPHGAAASAPVDPCQDHGRWVEHTVAAIDVKMVLNGFGDRDDHAFMYVLDKNIDRIRAWEQRRGCTSWDPSGLQKQHKSCVSTGLRDDLVQPLVLRANLGQCVVIHFINRLDPKKKPPLAFDGREWPNDGKASLDVSGLAYSVEKAGEPTPDLPTETTVGSCKETTCTETLTYKIPLPTDSAAERAYYFHDGGGNRQRVPHGLFGVIVAEPAGSQYLDPKTGERSDGTGWEAIIAGPRQRDDFREFVVIYHEIGDENYGEIIDGTGDNTTWLPQLLPGFTPEPLYRPAGRALNYRSEPFHHRLELKGQEKNRKCSDISKESPDLKECSFKQKKALGYSSYTFGDPATPIPRSYLGEPTKTRLVHGGSEVFHVHHLHGGGDRWRRNPRADPNNDIFSGLNKLPRRDVLSTHLDSQTIGPGTSYNLEHECGAGGCQGAAGDFLYHCHIGHHYIGGMWGLWRVFDTLQAGLAKLPDMTEPPEAIDSTQLLGKTFEGKTVVAKADPKDPRQVSLGAWVESQLPPQGRPLDDDDATVWDWHVDESSGYPQYLGEPETGAEWVNYPSDSRSDPPGSRPVIRFNPTNGRYAWPLFRPHLGQRPPFAPNGHSGAPWLGERGSKDRRDGLCPDPKEWGLPHQEIRHYPISAVPIDLKRNEAELVDDKGKVFVLNEDLRGETPEGKALLAKTKKIEPLVIRSNVGDCVRVILTSRLKPDIHTGSKVNMHTHFVQFDPQASDGVITGFSYEQSVRPYADEKRLAGDGPANELRARELTSPVPAGAQQITVNQVYRLLDETGQPRSGVWIGVGLGEGLVDQGGGCPATGGEAIPRTEIRRIQDIRPDANTGTFTITLDRPFEWAHQAGEAVGVEFVQYLWYSDVDTGTVFWHDHVDFNSWAEGLASAHVIEPAASTWHDPSTGDPVRSGSIVDVHAPADASVGVGQKGSFREFVLLNTKDQSGRDFLDERKASINLYREPIVDPRVEPDSVKPEGCPTSATVRCGNSAHWFSSVTHGDPATPLPRAYVGDPFMIRHLGVLDREGGIRVTGHRFRLERFAPGAAFTDGSPIGISERYDLLLDGGAGGPLRKPGDFLYYNTLGRDMLGGAWGLIRVHDTRQRGEKELKPLPDRPEPPEGSGFPTEPLAAKDNTRATPKAAEGPGDPCRGAREEKYEVEIRNTTILQQQQCVGDIGSPKILQQCLDAIKSHPELTVKDAVAFGLLRQPGTLNVEPALSVEPLVLRVNQGDCLVVELTNKLQGHASLNVGELIFDPQGSHGSAIGLNRDSTVPPGGKRVYRYFADRDLGTAIALDLANPVDAARGAFAAVVVEPTGAQYRNPATGEALRTGVLADIVAPDQKFRELVTLFHDGDPLLGHNFMSYPWKAMCDPNFPPEEDPKKEKCSREARSFRGSFTSISYKLTPWSLREDKQAPSDVYNSKAKGPDGKEHGDPGLVISGTPGFPLMFRVAAPWAEQVHAFSLSGHRWRLEPGLTTWSEQVFAHTLAPGYAFDAFVIGGFGGEHGKIGDFVFGDARMPFTQAGLWGLIRVRPAASP